uniref:Uncharacterized protein n=1 Tax=Ciona savignyi TaxID=51511 RepID=H2Y8T5_CIOSA
MKLAEREQEMMLSHLKHRCSILDNATKYSSSLESLLTCLLEAEKLRKVNYETMVKRQMSDAYSVSGGEFPQPHRGLSFTNDATAGNSDDDIWSSGDDKDRRHKNNDSANVAGAESSASLFGSTKTNGGQFSISEDDNDP